jgi:hypothetical protein
MSDPYYTITGPRPDLAAIEVNPPEGYIAQLLAPTVPVVDKSGYVFYRTVTSDVTAQTNRVTLNAPDSTAITNSNTTFTCAEKIKRGEIAPDEAKSMGGIAKADMVGTKFAKRSVLNALEVEVAAQLTGQTADVAFDSAKILGQAQVALDAVRRIYGKTMLLGATITLKRAVQAILGDNTYGPVLSRIVSGTSPSVATTGLNFSAWMNALAMFLGVDQVLAGDDSVWNDGANENKLCIGKFDSGSEELVHKYEPVWARNFMYLPDGVSPWFVETIADRNVKSNKYDASVWNNLKVLNSAAKYVIGSVPA